MGGLIFGVVILLALWGVVSEVLGIAILVAIPVAALALGLVGAPFMGATAIFAKLSLRIKSIRDIFSKDEILEEDVLCMFAGAFLGFSLTYMLVPVLALVLVNGIDIVDSVMFGPRLAADLAQDWGWPKTLLAFLAAGVPGLFVGGYLGWGARIFYGWFYVSGSLREAWRRSKLRKYGWYDTE